MKYMSRSKVSLNLGESDYEIESENNMPLITEKWSQVLGLPRMVLDTGELMLNIMYV